MEFGVKIYLVNFNIDQYLDKCLISTNTNSCVLLGRIENFLNKFYNKLYIMVNVENTQTIVNDSEKKIISFIIYFVGIIINGYFLEADILDEVTVLISSCIFSIMTIKNFQNRDKFILTIYLVSVSLLHGFLSLIVFFFSGVFSIV